MSSTAVGSIHYDLTLDTSKFDRAADAVTGKIKSVGESMSSLGTKMTAFVTAPIVAGIGASIKAASDLNETLNKVDVAFADQAQVVRAWAKTSTKSMGLAQQSALDAAALFGDMATSMGLNTKAAADMSTGLVQLGADLSSFKNISFSEAQTALSGVFTGETESLKRLGIVMTQANLQAYALSKGINKSVQEMSQAELVSLRYSYILSVTKNAQGDFARTASGTANTMRSTSERVKELSAQIGQNFLPWVNKALATMSQWMDRFQALNPAQQQLIIKIALVVAALGPLLIIVGNLITAFGVVASVLLGPVGLALAGLVATAIILHNVFDGWKNAVSAVKDALQSAYNVVAPILIPSLQALWNVIQQQLWPALQRLWATISPVLIPALQWLASVAGGILVTALYAFINTLRIVIQVLSYLVSAISNAIQWTRNLGEVFYQVAPIIIGKVQEVLRWLSNLPAMIRGAVGDMSGVLWNAGVSLITGFWSGMKQKWNEVSGWLKSRATEIRTLKGPIDKDRIMLVNEGMAVMEGFNNGLLAGYKNVRSTLTGVTADLASGATVGNAAVGASGGINTATNFYQPVNIYNSSDAQSILRMISSNQQLTLQGVAISR